MFSKAVFCFNYARIFAMVQWNAAKMAWVEKAPASLTKETITFLFIGLIFILVHLHICIYTYTDTYLNVYYIFTLGTRIQYNTESLYVDILLAARRMASSASKKLAHGSLSLLLSILLMRCRQRFSDGQMLPSFNQPVYLWSKTSCGTTELQTLLCCFTSSHYNMAC